MPTLQTLAHPDGQTLAYQTRPGAGPGVLWLGGFKSDMTGTKASALDAWAAARGRAFLRFDYFGHGASSGDFRQGTITRWRDDALLVLDRLCEGPQILVGSSMGGWIALLAALARPDRVAALVLIAPAPDFTEALMWAQMPPEVQTQIMTTGEWQRPSAYDPEPYPITRRLIEDGRRHLLLGRPIRLEVPIRILQGMEDPDVPWQHALALMGCLSSRDVIATFTRAGDHRLSTPEDLARLARTLDDLTDQLSGASPSVPLR